MGHIRRRLFMVFLRLLLIGAFLWTASGGLSADSFPNRRLSTEAHSISTDAFSIPLAFFGYHAFHYLSSLKTYQWAAAAQVGLLMIGGAFAAWWKRHADDHPVLEDRWLQSQIDAVFERSDHWQDAWSDLSFLLRVLLKIQHGPHFSPGPGIGLLPDLHHLSDGRRTALLRKASELIFHRWNERGWDAHVSLNGLFSQVNVVAFDDTSEYFQSNQEIQAYVLQGSAAEKIIAPWVKINRLAGHFREKVHFEEFPCDLKVIKQEGQLLIGLWAALPPALLREPVPGNGSSSTVEDFIFHALCQTVDLRLYVGVDHIHEPWLRDVFWGDDASQSSGLFRNVPARDADGNLTGGTVAVEKIHYLQRRLAVMVKETNQAWRQKRGQSHPWALEYEDTHLAEIIKPLDQDRRIYARVSHTYREGAQWGPDSLTVSMLTDVFRTAKESSYPFLNRPGEKAMESALMRGALANEQLLFFYELLQEAVNGNGLLESVGSLLSRLRDERLLQIGPSVMGFHIYDFLIDELGFKPENLFVIDRKLDLPSTHSQVQAGRYLQGDIKDRLTEFSPETFGLIFGFHVVETLSSFVTEPTSEQLAMRLAPDGILGLTVLKPESIRILTSYLGFPWIVERVSSLKAVFYKRLATNFITGADPVLASA